MISTNFGTFEAVSNETSIMLTFGYPTNNETMYTGSLRLNISNNDVQYKYATAFVITKDKISLYNGNINILKILAR